MTPLASNCPAQLRPCQLRVAGCLRLSASAHMLPQVRWWYPIVPSKPSSPQTLQPAPLPHPEAQPVLLGAWTPSPDWLQAGHSTW